MPITGRYYIYMQMYMHNRGRIYVIANSRALTMTHPMVASDGTMFAAGVFKLNAGDVIMLKVSPQQPARVYMAWFHSYFGAYLI